MFLQQSGIPDNVSFLVLGMVVLFTLFGGWVASYLWRLRNLRRDIQLLEQMNDEADAGSAVQSRAASREDAAPPTTQPST